MYFVRKHYGGSYFVPSIVCFNKCTTNILITLDSSVEKWFSLEAFFEEEQREKCSLKRWQPF